MRFASGSRRQLRIRLSLGLLVFVGALYGVASVYARQDSASREPQSTTAAKPESFLASNPPIGKTIEFINGTLVSKIRFVGTHNPTSKVLIGKSQLHFGDDHHRRYVKLETPVMEDMANDSDSPRSHLSVATAFRDDLNVQAASSNGDYVMIPCKAGRKCVDNRLLLADSYDQAPASLPGLGTLMAKTWAPPSMLAIGPFPEGQAESMVPVVRYLLSK
jgi:hypothetical protein